MLHYWHSNHFVQRFDVLLMVNGILGLTILLNLYVRFWFYILISALIALFLQISGKNLPVFLTPKEAPTCKYSAVPLGNWHNIAHQNTPKTNIYHQKTAPWWIMSLHTKFWTYSFCFTLFFSVLRSLLHLNHLISFSDCLS